MSGSSTIQISSSRASELFARAVQVLPGGVTASARLIPFLKRPLYMTRGEGAYVFDLDGKRYIDFWNSHGASLLGYKHPAVNKAVQSVLDMGMLCASETELQVALAERICQVIPSAEQVRFTTSGTETTWHALRVARAFTGRTHVIRFEGHFHGFNDIVGFNHGPSTTPIDADGTVAPRPESAGMPPDSNEHISVVPFNDLGALELAIKAHASDLAAVILEPINFDCFGIKPEPGFLEALKEMVHKVGAVLIFDEILSGFRTGPGCAQEYFGVTPDMCTLGKAMGGGMPLSAFAGRRDIMQSVTPVGKAVHSGTYNSHLTAIAASLAFFSEIARPDFYPHLRTLGDRLYSGMSEIFARRGLKVWVQGVGARFGLIFGLDSEPKNARDTLAHDPIMAGRFYEACLKRGVYFHHVSLHHGFSSAHTLQDIEETLAVVDDVAAEVAGAAR